MPYTNPVWVVTKSANYLGFIKRENMKKLAFILTLSFPLIRLTQNVAINKDNSEQGKSAILDIRSENEGFY
jgi:hypothetical protein